VGEIQLPGALNGAAWSQVITNLDSNHRDLVRGWFSGLIPERLDRGILDVRAASSDQVSYLDQWCGPIFADAIREITGHLVAVHFHCNGNGHHTNGRRDIAPQPIPLTFEIEAVRLNPEYTFESFVTGPSNQLAHAACLAVSDAPGRSYNPLFIHGDVGLGKSHLLQAVCHAIHHGHQPAEILYLTGENFANHFIEAVERGALHNFRNRYRHVDVLVVDDIQFLAGHERTQEEFFHTFNTLYQEQKQIILASDAPPSEISTLEQRLISRFNWGLVTRIDKPCLETRMAIIKKKARIRCIDLPRDVVHLVASRVQSNTRELEGIITKLDLLSRQSDGKIDRTLALSALGDIPEQDRGKAAGPPAIVEAVSAHFGVKVSEIQSRRRTKSIALPRQVCMFLTRKLSSMSLEEIGGFFGGRDHSTVLHAIRHVEQFCGKDPAFKASVDHLLASMTPDG